MIPLLILLVIVLFLSALCSMVEAAVLSLPFIRARVLFEQKRKGAKSLLFIKENIHLAVATIVILNNSINIIGSIFVGQWASRIFGSHWLGISSAIITMSVIVVGEVIPKTIGEHYKAIISLRSAPVLHSLMWLFKPLVGILILFANPFKKRPRLLQQVTEEEIRIMLRLGRDEGTVEMDEETLCNRVFKLNDLTAVSMMKPIATIYALDANKSLADAKDAIINSPHSRIVVYDGTSTNIIGIAQHRVLLREIAKDNYSVKIRDFISRPIFVDAAEKADKLLEKFQSNHQHLFIVRNSRKELVGILTMEDVLEELFGEIYDEKDKAA